MAISALVARGFDGNTSPVRSFLWPALTIVLGNPRK